MMKGLKADLTEVQTSHRTAARAAVEKVNMITPNPFSTYPKRDAPDETFVKAITTMQGHVKVIERTYTFLDKPFDFLVELCGSSNTVATTHKLSRDQQRLLLLHFLPSTSPLNKMVKSFSTLEEIFRYASTSSSVIMTRAELEKTLDNWKINVSSFTELNVSIAVLKSILMELNPHKFEGKDKNKLYILMARQINRQKLNAWVNRSLEEIMLKLENEHDEGEMYAMILSVLKGLVKHHNTQITHAIDNISPVQAQTVSGSAGNNNGAKPKVQAQNQNANNQQKQKQNTGNTGGKRGRNQNQGRRSRSQSRSKSRQRFTTVPPWPKDKKYLNHSSNALTAECNNWFKNFCFKCGISNHKAEDCKIYDSKLVLTLCSKCFKGFHEHCKYPVKNNQGNNSGKGGKNSEE
jgi:hypothetical protein